MEHLILLGIGNAFTPINLGAMVLGVVIGMIFGAIPGLSGATAMSLLLPLTFVFRADTGVLFLIAIWNAAVYAGSISAICLNIPGTAAAAACAIEGHLLAQRGLARRALRASIVGATIGGFVAAISLLFLSPPLAELALTFGPAEMFSFAVFGMAAVVSLASGSLVRGLCATGIGLLIAAVGTTPMGDTRLVFTAELTTGFPMIPTLVGLFTFPVLLEMLYHRRTRMVFDMHALDVKETFLLRWADWAQHWFTIARSAVIGVFLGVVPGHGPTLASFISLGEARRSARPGHEFGRGDITGVLAPETAANAAVFSSLVPALTLGNSGQRGRGDRDGGADHARHAARTDAAAEQRRDAVYRVRRRLHRQRDDAVRRTARRAVDRAHHPRAAGAAGAADHRAVAGRRVHREWRRVRRVSGAGDGPGGFVLRLLRMPLAALVLGMILGGPLETYFLQAHVLYGSVWAAFTRPVCLTLLLLTLAAVAYSLAKEFRARRVGLRLGQAAH